MEQATISGRVDAIDAEIRALANADANMGRLMENSGIRPTIASALVAAVGTGGSFFKRRVLAAGLDLVPRQVPTGGKATLFGIQVYRNRYLRKLFTICPPVVLHLVHDRKSQTSQCVGGLKVRVRIIVAAVAMPNKMARMSLVVLTRG